MGPNGRNLLNYMTDCQALNSSGLADALLGFARLAGSPRLVKLFQRLEDTMRFNTYLPAGQKPKIGALGRKAEGGGKIRVFAMIDYFSQCALKPLHDYLDKILDAIPQDGTFNQDKVADMVKGWTKRRYKLYSFDLDSATDRFPVSLQEKLLIVLFNLPFAQAWRKLVCDRLYYFKSEPLKYSVGQPMGAYSS
jgi:hypothetical protein